MALSNWACVAFDNNGDPSDGIIKKLNQEEAQKYFSKLVDNVEKYIKTNRLGQIQFNTLYECYPEVADAIRDTPADPFYKETEKFWDAILEAPTTQFELALNEMEKEVK
jgi:hypothetical protein